MTEGQGTTQTTPATPTVATPVYDNFANDQLLVGKSAEAVNVSGNKAVCVIQTFDIATAHGAGAIYRLFRMASNMIPLDIKIFCTAVTGATDCDLGIYEEGVNGKALKANVLADGLTLAAAKGVSSPLNGLSALTTDNLGKMIYELAGHTRENKDSGYDICLTANSAATAAGKVVVMGTFVQG